MWALGAALVVRATVTTPYDAGGSAEDDAQLAEEAQRVLLAPLPGDPAVGDLDDGDAAPLHGPAGRRNAEQGAGVGAAASQLKTATSPSVATCRNVKCRSGSPACML